MIPDLHSYSDDECETAAENLQQAIKSELEQMIESELDRLQEYAGEFLLPW